LLVLVWFTQSFVRFYDIIKCKYRVVPLRFRIKCRSFVCFSFSAFHISLVSFKIRRWSRKEVVGNGFESVHSQYLSRAFSYMECVFSVLVFVLLCFYVFGYVFFLFILHVLVLVRLTALRVTSLPLCFYPEAFRTVFLYFFLGLKARGSLAPRI